MYPLDLTRPSTDTTRRSVGFAVANDEEEHKKLSEHGFEPKFVAKEDPKKAPISNDEADPDDHDSAGHTVASVRAKLDEAKIPYDKRWGLEKLLTYLPKE